MGAADIYVFSSDFVLMNDAVSSRKIAKFVLLRPGKEYAEVTEKSRNTETLRFF